ncbi:MAG: leucyl/phenylalanyl-tRNA--protein transferase [Bacteroidota bacterium]
MYQLIDELIFPPVSEAEEGVVAIGGDLKPERLMLAYQSGIFPWYNEQEPIIWWSPDPRMVLFPERLHISRSMKRILKKAPFQITFNQDFQGVISHCKKISRRGQSGTWITREMQQAYSKLHTLGFASSVEVWENEELVGGMYGVDLGTVFCGESMFSLAPNASKVALISFMQKFQERGGRLLDCQVYSDHLASLGAEEISRADFLLFLETA